MAFNASGSFPAHLQPTATKSLFSGNYLGSSSLEFMNQFLPDVYEKEFERYGNRSISSFLRMVSAEMPSASDLIQWTEQGRLHTRYIGVTNGAQITSADTGATAIVFTVPLAQPGPNITKHVYRVGQTVMLQNTASATAVTGTAGQAVLKGIITAVGTGTSTNGGTFSVNLYNASALGTTTYAASSTFTTLVFGSEFAKGTGSMTEGVDAEYQSFTNKPIIIKDYYQVDGSDVAQIGWIEVTSENGANGFLWYLKSEHETRLRFEDYLEMTMVEGVAAGTGITAASQPFAKTGQVLTGSEGFFAALEDRGNVYNDFTGTGSGTTIPSASEALNEFDNIVYQLDKQGSIEENMLFVNRELSLEIDDSLAAQNSFYSGGASWGVFNNEKDMALNLGFNGWRRGSYDFYKTDWKYLNDYATRGGFSDIEGVLVPAGTSTVYDQNLGKNIKRPFLHVRYRASEADNRKMKSWVTGTVGGAYTDSQDTMRVNFLSERCLITQGANNFVLFKKTT